jgi:NADPH:quinone reductase-like Zn-dependent oxidoreductase
MRLMLGLTGPKAMCPGRDVAGQVEAVGRNVRQFKPGDEVFGACRGAFAEFACASESKLVRKPAGVTFEQAASVPIAGLTALQAIRDKGRLRPGERVLVNGAAGGVGMFAVQIAKSMKAEVTGVCSTRNVEMVRSLGADRVIDYTRDDFTRMRERYDVMLDCICNHSLSARRGVLTRDGRLVVVGAPPGRWMITMLASLVQPLVVAPFVSQELTVFVANIRQADLVSLGELMASGALRAVIDRREGLAEVPNAVRDVAARHVRGKLVIVV